MSDLERFVKPIDGFVSKPAPFQVQIFAWYLQEARQKERFSATDIAQCFDAAHMKRPINISLTLSRLAEKKPARVLRDSKGFRLSSAARVELAALLPLRATSVATTQLLDSLQTRLTDPAQRTFLSETLTCFKHQAYRASIVMMWNLTYAHICDKIFVAHAVPFEAQRAKVHKNLPSLTKRTDFEDYGERQVIEICRGARIFDGTVCKILTERLNRRNSAAHPSSATFTVANAEDMITDLVNNVLLNPNV